MYACYYLYFFGVIMVLNIYIHVNIYENKIILMFNIIIRYLPNIYLLSILFRIAKQIL